MSAHATGTFEVKTWDEKLFDEFGGGGKLTRASVTKCFHGDIEGEGKVEYLMIAQSGKSTDSLSSHPNIRRSLSSQ